MRIPFSHCCCLYSWPRQLRNLSHNKCHWKNVVFLHFPLPLSSSRDYSEAQSSNSWDPSLFECRYLEYLCFRYLGMRCHSNRLSTIAPDYLVTGSANIIALRIRCSLIRLRCMITATSLYTCVMYLSKPAELHLSVFPTKIQLLFTVRDWSQHASYIISATQQHHPYPYPLSDHVRLRTPSLQLRPYLRLPLPTWLQLHFPTTHADLQR